MSKLMSLVSTTIEVMQLQLVRIEQRLVFKLKRPNQKQLKIKFLNPRKLVFLEVVKKID